MMPERPFTIAVDAMGGDLGPEEIVRGVVRAATGRDDSLNFILVGDESVLKAELARPKSAPSTISIRHASQIIEMTDKPREAYRKKPDASVVVAARMVKDGDADAFISIGNTGAAMAAAVFLMRPLPGIDRPAIATPLPSLRDTVVLLDAGANVDCTPRQLLDFALMGQVYSRHVLGKANPKVALLSNGAEESKGNELTKVAHKLLKSHVQSFFGNIEGMDIFRGRADVVVCDGFSGNIVLKVGEGVAEMVLSMVRQELTRHKWMKIFLLPLRKGVRELRNRIDYREFGGAPLLGVNGICIIGHGRSDARAIVNAIKVAETALKNHLVAEIQKAICAAENGHHETPGEG
jgi:glycerol-3-phosphate acyltransferase PlsX